ncbi:MAG: sigma-70 family RNA polymerase sigma factor [Bacillota bacterium]|nr:sigma-70 family RNA polymerase sigma factor [Bacillota bacterium]
MTDEEIIEQVLGGNIHIFSEIVDRYKDYVFNLIYRFTYNYCEAEDISQEIFINIYKKLDKFHGGSKFSTWIYRISYNLCIDWYRKNKNKPPGVSLEDFTEPFDKCLSPEETVIDHQKAVELHKSIMKLDKKYIDVLILFYFQEQSYEEISTVLDLPVKTVETRLYRGRNLLRKEFGLVWR